jgi:predicted dehydrogenase
MVGCGQIASDGYLPALSFLQRQVELFDPDLQAAQALSKRHTNSTVLNDLRSSTATSAVVAVPPSLLRSALTDLYLVSSRVRHVLVEKPLGTSFEEANRIVEESNKAGVELRYMETFVHSSVISAMLEEISSRRQGRLESIELQFRGSIPSNLDTAWRGERRLGGEVVHDWGIHSIGLLLYLLSRLGFAPVSSSDVGVTSASWSGSTRKRLTAVSASLSHPELSIFMKCSWEPEDDRPDMILQFNRSRFELSVQKVEGRSSWTLSEFDSEGNHVFKANARYPKELFVRGLMAFETDLGSNDAMSVQVGLQAMSIADEIYEQASKQTLVD